MAKVGLRRWVLLLVLTCMALTSACSPDSNQAVGLDTGDSVPESEVGVLPSDPSADAFTDTVDPGQENPLAFYTGSTEYQAAQEWQAYLNGYDQDGSKRSAQGNSLVDFDIRYTYYSCYTQEMVDELEELSAKYGLGLLNDRQSYSSNQELYILASTGDFLGDANKVQGGYIYEDGTFQFDGYHESSSGVAMYYQLRCTKLGVIDCVVVDFDAIGGYEAHDYRAASGVDTVLVLSPSKAFIMVDLGTAVIKVNVHDDVTFEDLELLADAFDFKQLPAR